MEGSTDGREPEVVEHQVPLLRVHVLEQELEPARGDLQPVGRLDEVFASGPGRAAATGARERRSGSSVRRARRAGKGKVEEGTHGSAMRPELASR